MNRPRRATPRHAMRVAVARELLARSPMQQTRRGTYKAGFRTFGHRVIDQLVAAGEAMQLADGSVVATATEF